MHTAPRQYWPHGWTAVALADSWLTLSSSKNKTAMAELQKITLFYYKLPRYTFGNRAGWLPCLAMNKACGLCLSPHMGHRVKGRHLFSGVGALCHVYPVNNAYKSSHRKAIDGIFAILMCKKKCLRQAQQKSMICLNKITIEFVKFLN